MEKNEIKEMKEIVLKKIKKYISMDVNEMSEEQLKDYTKMENFYLMLMAMEDQNEK